MRNPNSAISAVIITVISSTGMVHARDIPAEDDLWCVYRIEGVISEQTLLDLEIHAERISEGMLDDNAAVCLNSPGGNFVVGMRISELIHFNRWRTAVTSEARCMSACAIAFMGGTSSIGMYTHHYRVVYPGAQIGFHAPRLVIGAGVYSETSVSSAYELALQSIAELINLGETNFMIGHSSLLNTHLLFKIISTPPSDFWLPQTINQFVLADIGVWTPPPPSGDDFYVNICDNFVSRHGEDGNTSRPASQIQSERMQNREGMQSVIYSEEYAWVPGYWRGVRNTMTCRVRREASRTYMLGEAFLVQLIEHDWGQEPPIEPNNSPHAIEVFRYAAPQGFGHRPDSVLADMR